MSSGNFFSPAGLSAAATILLTLPGQVQASAENYQYQMKFSADAQSIRPTTVFDDGKATWFVIPSDPRKVMSFWLRSSTVLAATLPI